MFHDPPGTPKELKCVNCKIAIGSLLLGLGGISAIVAKKLSKRSVYQMMSLVGVTGACVSSSVVTFRLAYDHSKYNENLKAQRAKEISKQRKEKLLERGQQLA